MDNEQIKEKMLEFLRNNTLMVISSIAESGEKPQAAVVAFSQNDNLELIFGTSNTTRKYKNIQKNPHVACVIGWDSEVGTVQYEGIAKEMSADESEKYGRIMLSKSPRSEKFVLMESQRYFVIKPTWIRLTDMTVRPHPIHVMTFPG